MLKTTEAQLWKSGIKAEQKTISMAMQGEVENGDEDEEDEKQKKK